MLKLNNKISNTNRLDLSQIGDKWDIDFGPLISEKLDLYKLTTFSPNKKLPIHNWFQYLQGFSAPLVEMLLKEFDCTKKSIVLDPWCGVGTTNLVCKSNSIKSYGVDISPLAVFVTQIKLNGMPSEPSVHKRIKSLKKKYDKLESTHSVSEYDIINKTISSPSLANLIKLKSVIKEVKDKELADFLFLAMLNSLSQLSTFKKDGAHYRFLDKPQSDDVFGVFESIINFMLKNDPPISDNLPSEALCNIYTGDSRKLDMIRDNTVDCIITSPPYLNRDNYIAQHKLDLMFGDFVNDYEHYRNLTFSTLRSHVEAKPSGYDYDINIQALNNYELELENRREHFNNSNILPMFRGYFIDMFYSLKEVARVLKRQGKAAIVVGNSCWAGVSIEVDKLLCEIARQHGLETRAIWVTRYKLNSAQQIVTFGKVPVRESIIIMEKL